MYVRQGRGLAVLSGKEYVPMAVLASSWLRDGCVEWTYMDLRYPKKCSGPSFGKPLPAQRPFPAWPFLNAPFLMRGREEKKVAELLLAGARIQRDSCCFLSLELVHLVPSSSLLCAALSRQ